MSMGSSKNGDDVDGWLRNWLPRVGSLDGLQERLCVRLWRHHGASHRRTVGCKSPVPSSMGSPTVDDEVEGGRTGRGGSRAGALRAPCTISAYDFGGAVLENSHVKIQTMSATGTTSARVRGRPPPTTTRSGWEDEQGLAPGEKEPSAPLARSLRMTLDAPWCQNEENEISCCGVAESTDSTAWTDGGFVCLPLLAVIASCEAAREPEASMASRHFLLIVLLLRE